MDRDRVVKDELGRPLFDVVVDRRALAERVCERYREVVDDWPALVETLLRPLPVTLWANPLRLSRERLVELLARSGIHARPLEWSESALELDPGARPGLHWGFFAGLFQVQEAVSMLPVQLLDPQPGERVLDLCAAPGNKTAQIAVAMRNTGTVVANDLNRGRVPAIRQTVKRLGLMNVAVTVKDGQGLTARAGLFDRVLVDAPCTCEGTFRKVRVPQVVTDRFRESTTRTQRRLLERAVALVRPGGRVVYSTCTFSPEENEAVVDAVIGASGGTMRLLPASIPGFPTGQGLTSWQGRRFDPQLSLAMRIWPHHANTGGFFVAVLEKRDDGPAAAPAEYFRPPEESAEWLSPFVDRLGIPAQVFADVSLVKRGNRHVHLVPRDHRLPQAPAPDMLGLPAVRRRSLPLKPTTAAVLLYGHLAVRNRVELSTVQLRDYLERADTSVEHSQLARCTGPGYVVVTYQEQTVGLGQLIYERESPRVWLRSLMPKAWRASVAEEVS
ncbi:MAG: RsmB/NOP family class I SAM-dependent RNA methyltransferase [Ectothiorhodospiraceae bacterium]|nr:RsmB/NOP family class I SAM-dependent RNA methyltransferase [Ectothiorhodospiraceae bacterium]